MISVDVTSLVICLLVFGLVFVLKNLFFEPLAQAMETRQAQVDKAATASDAAKQTIEAARQQLASAVQSIRNDGYKLLDGARMEAQTQGRSEVDQGRTRAQALVADAKSKLSEESDRAVKALESDSDALATEIASRILGREIA